MIKALVAELLLLRRKESKAVQVGAKLLPYLKCIMRRSSGFSLFSSHCRIISVCWAELNLREFQAVTKFFG